MNEISFPDSTLTTRSTDDFSVGELHQNFVTQWDQLSNVTNVVEYPLTRRERGFICWLVCTQLPDPALEDLATNILESIEFYRKRFEYRQRQRPKLQPREVTVELGETTIRPRIYLPTDAD